MILYIEDPRFDREDGKHFTLKYRLPRSTRKIFIQSIPPVNPPADPEIEAPIKGSPFKLKIFKHREDWTNNYEDPQCVEETIEYVGTRTFSEGSKVANILAAAGLGATVGAGVGELGGPVGIAIGVATGGVIGAAVGALLHK